MSELVLFECHKHIKQTKEKTGAQRTIVLFSCEYLFPRPVLRACNISHTSHAKYPAAFRGSSMLHRTSLSANWSPPLARGIQHSENVTTSELHGTTVPLRCNTKISFPFFVSSIISRSREHLFSCRKRRIDLPGNSEKPWKIRKRLEKYVVSPFTSGAVVLSNWIVIGSLENTYFGKSLLISPVDVWAGSHRSHG